MLKCEVLVTGGNLLDQKAVGDCWKTLGEGIINISAVLEDRPK